MNSALDKREVVMLMKRKVVLEKAPAKLIRFGS
jgi:hypothetical protein